MTEKVRIVIDEAVTDGAGRTIYTLAFGQSRAARVGIIPGGLYLDQFKVMEVTYLNGMPEWKVSGLGRYGEITLCINADVEFVVGDPSIPFEIEV